MAFKMFDKVNLIKLFFLYFFLDFNNQKKIFILFNENLELLNKIIFTYNSSRTEVEHYL